MTLRPAAHRQAQQTNDLSPTDQGEQ